jgi:nucleoside-diphosphate-sugar epimerase
MKVLVIGATGYIGGVVAERLDARGHQVVALVRPGTDPVGLPARAEVRTGSLTEPTTLAAALTADVDGVLNLATPSGDPATDRASTAALLAPLHGTGRPYLYTSGIWVLGATGPEPADEETPTDPIRIVGHRPAVEQQVLAAAADGVRSLVVRPAVVHGRGGGIPALLVQQAASRGRGRYVGDPATRWPMVHVDDLADLVVAALERAPAGTLLHAVAEQGVPVADLALAAAQAAGVAGRTESWPVDEAAAVLGAPFAEALALSQVCRADRARRELGWRPSRPGAVDDLAHGSYARTLTRA